MPKFGTCEICNNEWYTLTKLMKVRRPTHIPTCPEGDIMAVCDDCFATASSNEIILAAIRAYKKSQKWDVDDPTEKNVVHIRMTPTEHLLVEASIKAWVPYMKHETTERPFGREALTL